MFTPAVTKLAAFSLPAYPGLRCARAAGYRNRTLQTSVPNFGNNRFIVPKSVERAETKVTFGPELFPFLENERYVFKYSFRAVDGMKLGKRCARCCLRSLIDVLCTLSPVFQPPLTMLRLHTYNMTCQRYALDNQLLQTSFMFRSTGILSGIPFQI